MIADIKNFIYFYWPVVLIGILLFNYAIEYRRYRQEKQVRRYAPPPSPPVLPDRLVLVRSLDQLPPERRKLLLTALMFLLVSLFVLLMVSVVRLYPDKSWSELLHVLFDKISERPAAFINMLIVFVLLAIAPFYIIAMNKNERLILSKETITYIPPFSGRLQRVLGAWSLRWEEIASITLGRGLMRGRLKIKPRRGRMRVLMAYAWQQAGNPLGQQYKTLFARIRFRYKLQNDVDTALQYLPLLRYLQEKLGLSLDAGNKSDLEFDLLKHPATRQILVVLAALIFYALVDLMANMETYLQTPSVLWFVGMGAAITLAVVAWLGKGSIPRSNVWGLALITGAVFAVAMYPGLLRLNQFTATSSLRAYPYRYAGDYRFSPRLDGLPVIVLPESDYWDSKKPHDEFSFVLRKGGLGFYQIDMAPVYADMRIWYCQKNAKGDTKKLTQCGKQE